MTLVSMWSYFGYIKVCLRRIHVFPIDLNDFTIHPANADKSEGGGLQNTSFSTISDYTAVGAVFLRSGAFERISRDSIL